MPKPIKNSSQIGKKNHVEKDAWPWIESSRLIKDADQKEYPTVSIIIPSFNHGSSIEAAICSVIHQTYPFVECIVIDGGSTDETIEILQRYDAELNYWISEKDEGVYDAMNKGIRMASGEFVFFLGSDDILAGPKVLEEIFSILTLNEYDVIYGKAYYIHKKLIYGGLFTLETLLMDRKNICHQTIFYKRNVFSKIGYFNLAYKVLADYDLNLRIFTQPEFKTKYLDIIISNFNDKGMSSVVRDPVFKKDLVRQYVIPFGNFEKIYYDYLAQKQKLIWWENLTAWQYFKKAVKKLLNQ